jgi:MFS family permease
MFRLIQGFALGGEVGASTAFLVEAAPPTRRAFYVSLQAATQYVAVLAAGLVAFGLATLLSPAALDQWGWRAAFLAGATIVPFGLALRRGLPETLHLPEAAASGRAATQLSPLVVGCSLLIIGSATIGGYGMDYMAVYAQDTLKLPPQIAFGCTIITGLVGVVASLAAGLLADRMGRKPIMLVSVALQIAMAVPAFLAMNATRSVSVLYTAVAVLGVVQNFADNASLVLITESLPKRMRSGALSVLYATSTAVFGGSAQFVIKALLDATGNPIAPAFYMTAALFVGGAAMVMMRETRPTRQTALS